MQVKTEENGSHVDQTGQLNECFLSDENEGEVREAKRVCTGVVQGNVNHIANGAGGPAKTEQRIYHNEGRHIQPPPVEGEVKCPRCESTNTKFCYYNNYSLLQPRYYCRACRRYWTKGGTIRNVPVGGGCRKPRRGSGGNSQQASPKVQQGPSKVDSLSLTPNNQVSTSPLVMSPMSPPTSPAVTNSLASILPFVAAQQVTGHGHYTPTCSELLQHVVNAPTSNFHLATTQFPPSASQSLITDTKPHIEHPYTTSSQAFHIQQSPIPDTKPIMEHPYATSSQSLHIQQPHAFGVAPPAVSFSSDPNANIYTFNISLQAPAKEPSQLTGFPYLPGHLNPYVSLGGPMSHPVENTGVFLAGDHDYLSGNSEEEQLICNPDYIQDDPDLDSCPDVNEGQEEGFKGFSLSFDQRYKLRDPTSESDCNKTDQSHHHRTNQGVQEQCVELLNDQMETAEPNPEPSPVESMVIPSVNSSIAPSPSVNCGISPALKVEEEP